MIQNNVYTVFVYSSVFITLCDSNITVKKYLFEVHFEFARI
jgi:hypothetical protein